MKVCVYRKLMVDVALTLIMSQNVVELRFTGSRGRAHTVDSYAVPWWTSRRTVARPAAWGGASWTSCVHHWPKCASWSRWRSPSLSVAVVWCKDRFASVTGLYGTISGHEASARHSCPWLCSASVSAWGPTSSSSNGKAHPVSRPLTVSFWWHRSVCSWLVDLRFCHASRQVLLCWDPHWSYLF